MSHNARCPAYNAIFRNAKCGYFRLFPLLPLCFVANLSATTIAEVSVEQLTQMSERCGVYEIRKHIPTGQSAEYDFSVVEEMCSSVKSLVFTVTLNESVVGTPRFKEGDRLFLFLRPSNRIEKVLGFRFHSYRVTSDGKILDYSGRSVQLEKSESDTLRGHDEAFHKLTPVQKNGHTLKTEESKYATVDGLRKVISSVVDR